MTLERARAVLAGALLSVIVLVLAALLGDDADDEGAWDADGELVAEGFSR